MRGNPRAAVAVLRELHLRPEHFRHALDERETLPFDERVRANLTVELREFGFEIERLHLRRRAREMDVNYTLRLCRVRELRRGRASLRAEQRTQRHAADAGRARLEKEAPCYLLDGDAMERVVDVHIADGSSVAARARTASLAVAQFEKPVILSEAKNL